MSPSAKRLVLIVDDTPTNVAVAAKRLPLVAHLLAQNLFLDSL